MQCKNELELSVSLTAQLSGDEPQTFRTGGGISVVPEQRVSQDLW